MKILLGSHNPAKVDYFVRQLEGETGKEKEQC